MFIFIRLCLYAITLVFGLKFGLGQLHKLQQQYVAAQHQIDAITRQALAPAVAADDGVPDGTREMLAQLNLTGGVE